MAFSDTEKINCLRLMMTENVGPVTYGHLLSYYGTATEALTHLPELARRGGSQKKLTPATVALAEEQFELAEKNNAFLIFRQESSYPALLRQISDAPPVLFVKGDIAVFQKKAVAIVGTRNASLNGKALARRVALDLAESGIQVVSGMAHGIDRAAHVGALSSSQKPATTAVLGTPVDEVYPQENQDIYEQISHEGCLISEFPFKSILSPRNFPRRNRIISGLSLGTLVIEAQMRSGSLITAKEAASQGREVFAVPGSPTDPRSAGPNGLIREGASLVTSAQDIIDILSNLHHFALTESDKKVDYNGVSLTDEALDLARKSVLDNLGTDPISIDALIRETGIDARTVSIILVELSLAGRLEYHAGHRVSLLYGV